MDQETRFENSWPALERQLRDVLRRRGVPVDAREDVLQETALRLLRSWERIRPESLWAFALTIALNVVRDEARRKERRDRTPLESAIVDRDPEHEALVRLELARVKAALESMTERQRTILLSEVGEATIVDSTTPALKMARMRARRRLRSLIEGASGYAALPIIRTRRWLQDADVGLANTAASLAVQIAAIVALSGAGLPSTIGPPSTPGGESDSGSGHTATAADPFLSDEDAVLPDAGERELRPDLATRRLTMERERGPGLNEHFGFVHKNGDSILVDDDAQVGPYGAHHTVAQTIAGSTVIAEAKARYEAADCVNEFLRERHAPCGDPGAGRGRLRTAVEEERHTIRVDTTRFN